MKSARRETEITFLRLVPGTSVVHRLWAGTKLVVAAILALVVSFKTSWWTLLIVTAVVIVGLLLGRIPLGAFPRLPAWFFGLLAIGAATSMLGSAEPVVHVGIDLSIGGLSYWARLTLLTAIIVVSGALVGWTTPLGELAPALGRLVSPLRRLHLPVDEWLLAIATAIRCLPLLIDEMRSIAAAQRLRKAENDRVQSLLQTLQMAHHLLATAIAASIRRARDLADAMVSRGGFGGVVADSTGGPGLVDAVVLVVVTAVALATVFLVPG